MQNFITKLVQFFINFFSSHYEFQLGESHHHELFKKGEPLASHTKIEVLIVLTKAASNVETIVLVEEFSKKYQLKVTEKALGKKLVRLTGTTENIEKAFRIKLHNYHGEGQQFYSHGAAYCLPKTLKGKVMAVLGLDNLPIHLKTTGVLPDITEEKAANNFTATELTQLYKFPEKLDGKGNTIAVIELGGGFAQSDIDAYFKAVNIPTPEIKTVLVGAAKNDPSDEQFSQEVLLDIQVVGSAAPGAQLVVYFAENSKKGYVDAVLAAVNDDSNLPTILSMSWGSPESQWPQAIVIAMEDALTNAKGKAITVIASSGDKGSTDGLMGSLSVNYPASSPFVLGCGGTTITTKGSAIIEEVVWNTFEDMYFIDTTGGGISTLFPVPAWQKKANAITLGNFSPAKTGRGVPDVSLHAQNYMFYQDGEKKFQSGTSAVVPMWAGLIARFNQGTNSKLGFVNEQLYGIWLNKETSKGFNDVLSGQNGDNFYKAAKGWDPCTGLGSPISELLLSELKKNNEV
ncbi:S53 family peptidase [Aureispira anguillae]|uniref:S53 family peptidase n=1 Tax=Aureispira anguillae TaxID=2864201 RepID=A0A916DVY7_9BACT|nr:S53 family peptidase [Aureispira anguillae]BDS13556.1 S53 family peptidase [Aureispira anguillae]